ncbi:hypothetical protein Glove_564g36 [Diversispora epigaea]|uniref:Uncharacterized protein n=1 Tax=Diversispora epigaea TaxID=1348612 RepID=A0A397GA77_9GLOM|nr:hypothetical protein Glove_564g36 [Diversispora epigaea]
MSGFDITTFLDKKDRTLSKPFNIHPGYDMRQKYVDRLKPKDLIQQYWGTECSKAITKKGSARIIQSVWRRFQEKEPSNAQLA